MLITLISLLTIVTGAFAFGASVGDRFSIPLEQSFGQSSTWRPRCEVSFEAFAGTGESSVVWRVNATDAGVLDADSAADAREAMISDEYMRIRVAPSKGESGDFAIIGAVRVVSTR